MTHRIKINKYTMDKSIEVKLKYFCTRIIRNMFNMCFICLKKFLIYFCVFLFGTKNIIIKKGTCNIQYILLIFD